MQQKFKKVWTRYSEEERKKSYG